VASTASHCHAPRSVCEAWPRNCLAFGSVPPLNPFWFVGGAAAVWAIVLTFALGLRNEDFPRTDSQARTVMLISIVLVAGAISSAIYAGISGAGDKTGFRHAPEAKK